MALKKIILNAEEINLPTKLSDLENDGGFLQKDVEGNVMLDTPDGEIYAPRIGSTSFICNDNKLYFDDNSLGIENTFGDTWLNIVNTGDGTKVLADDASYKTLPTKTSNLTNDTGFITSADVPTEIEFIEIAGAMESSDFAFTVDEVSAIVTAYQNNKTIVLKSVGTRLRFAQGWVVPNIVVVSQGSNHVLRMSYYIGNYYVALSATLTSTNTTSTIINNIIDLTADSGSSIEELTNATALTLEPNTKYIVTSPVDAVEVSSFTDPTELTAEYVVHFFTGDSVGGFSFPEAMLWANGTAPTIEASTAYELSVVATQINGNYVYKAVLTPFSQAS